MGFKNFLENTSSEWWKSFQNILAHNPSNDSIYNMLTHRDHPDILDAQYDSLGLKQQEERYKLELNKLATILETKGYQVDERSWFHVTLYDTKYQSNYPEVHAFKTYRTFIPRIDNKISSFLNSLPGLADALKKTQDENPTHPDSIEFKIPSKLKYFFNHPDTLVVHWRNRFNRKRINDTINNYFSQANIQFTDRGIRSTQGFDLHHEGSHTQVIALALENFVKLHPTIAYDKNEIEKWFNTFNRMSPTQIKPYLNINTFPKI